MTIIQNIAFGLAYIVGIPVLSVGCVALLYYINGQKSKLNFRWRKK